MTSAQKFLTTGMILLGPANAFFLARSIFLDRPVGYAIVSAIAMTVCVVMTLKLILEDR